MHTDEFPQVEVHPGGVNNVILEGQVALKIVAHCQNSLPHMVNGQLLGMDVGNTLHITASFPFLTRPDEEGTEEDFDQESTHYQYEMIRCLRDVNVDSSIVGWYCSTWQECFLNLNVIENHFSYQQELGKACIMLVHDPFITTTGQLQLRALRFQQRFMDLYAGGDLSQEAIKERGFTLSDIFEELPIQLRNNTLIDAFIGQLGASKEFTEACYLDPTTQLEASGHLAKTMETVVDGTDDMWQSLQKYVQEQRKHLKPSRLDSMLINKHLLQHCNYLEDTTTKQFENLYFAES